MRELQPNHICKNPECGKEYYSCDYCSYTKAYRAFACSKECYQKYLEALEKANDTSAQYPSVIGKTEDEVKAMVDNTTEAEAKAKTMEELSDYADDIAAEGLGAVVDKINAEMDNAKSNAKPKKSTKSKS